MSLPGILLSHRYRRVDDHRTPRHSLDREVQGEELEAWNKLQSLRNQADSGRLRRCLVLSIEESSQVQHSAFADGQLHS